MVEKVARATRPAEQRQQRSLFLLPPRVPAARSRGGRFAHRKKDLEEAVLLVQNKLAHSEDRRREGHCRARKSFVACVGKVQLNAAE